MSATQLSTLTHVSSSTVLRAKWLLGLVLVAYLVLGARLVRLQYLEHGDYTRKERSQIHTKIRLRPWRGPITDANGRILAISVPVHSCAIDPKLMQTNQEDLQQIADILVRHLDLAPRDLQRLHEGSNRENCRFIWVKRHLPDRQYQNLRREVQASGIKCVFFPQEYKRTYPRHGLGAHILGRTDIDGRGAEGIELIFDGFLRGNSVPRRLERDARGRLLAISTCPEAASPMGQTVELTIDSTIQMIVEQELYRSVNRYRGPATTGSAIVMNPYSGDILAMASLPGFDPNLKPDSAATGRLNLAISSIIEPGSTFKPFVMAAALQEHKLTTRKKFFCENGAWRMPNGRVLRDCHGYGWLTAEDVIVKSSNIGIAKVAALLGAKQLYRYMRAFGFGERTGITLPGELAAGVRHVSKWTSYSMGSVPMGQEIAVTPLQLITAYAALANGGLLMKPRIVKAARSTKSVLPASIRIRKRAITPEVAATMRRILGKVVARGTGRRARMKEYALGGKTGTSQMPVNAEEIRAGLRGYSHTRFISTFVALAPYDVPRIVILVTVREPVGAHYGGVVAAPAVKEIARRTLLYMKVEPGY